MTEENWPLVTEHDTAPAGRPDECFWCQQRIGNPHAQDCSRVVKTVQLKYTYLVEVTVPHHWTEKDVEFHRNESSWCADNSLDELEAHMSANECLCPRFSCNYIADVDETPRAASEAELSEGSTEKTQAETLIRKQIETDDRNQV